EDERMMVRQRRHARPEPDVPRALRRGGDEDLRRRDDLVAGGVMLADPRLVVGEAVERLDELEVAVQRPGGVVAHAVKRGEEDAEAETLGSVHGVVLGAGSG